MEHSEDPAPVAGRGPVVREGPPALAVPVAEEAAAVAEAGEGAAKCSMHGRLREES